MSDSSASNKSVCGSAATKKEISAEEISKALDEFGFGSPYEYFPTRATRRKSGENMFDPLNAKLGECDLNEGNEPTASTVGRADNSYVPAISKETLESEWHGMFGSKDYSEKLKTLALGGKLRDYGRFRGVCWRVFLECLPEDVDKWMESISELRAKYETLKSKYHINPYESAAFDKENVHVVNPLSQDDDNPWSQYFKDKKLREVILQDLDRLFPGMHYFQSKKIKNILLHILFCYARKNPSVGYKQGMHEILAPLVFVLEYDSEVYQFLKDSDNKLIKELVNPEYLEYDAFALFDHLMDIIEPWYTQTESPVALPKQSFDPMGVPFMEQLATTPPTAIVRKLNKIQESMLKKYDVVLYNHLRDFEIEPQLYGLRWVRLLFGREFTTMEDILTLWDGLFADGISLDLVDYVFISLLCNKRRKLLSSDHSDCLTTLMKTPFSKRGAKAVILEAKHLRDAKLNPAAMRAPGFYQPREEPRSSVKIEFPEPLQAKITGGLQAVLRSGRQVPTKKPSETKSHDNFKPKKPNIHKEHPAEERTRNVELKTNKKSAPASHLFPQDPEDEDLFTTSPRSRSSGGNFLSKLSSKVRNPSKTDLVTLKQDHERLQMQVSQFKAEVDKLQSISIYCGNKMDSYISILQEQMTREDRSMDIVYLSLAGLKQVRDILKGTLSFQASTMEQDSEFSHIDSVIASLNPAPSSVDSQNNTLPESMPVPLLADYGHFEGQNNDFILVEPDDQKDATNLCENSNSDVDPTKPEASEVLSNPGTVELNFDSTDVQNSQNGSNAELNDEKTDQTQAIVAVDNLA